MKQIVTFNDVHLALADKGAPTHRAVAIEMGMAPETFSRVIADRDGQPSPEWIKRFTEAYQARSRQVAS